MVQVKKILVIYILLILVGIIEPNPIPSAPTLQLTVNIPSANIGFVSSRVILIQYKRLCKLFTTFFYRQKTWT